MDRTPPDNPHKAHGEGPVRNGRRPPEPVIHSHAIAHELIDPDAIKVLRRLSRHGYKGYLVGGGVRDLLLGEKPKDFDIATDARPNQMRNLFRNCRIIGRRFRLAHVLFGGGKVIEVATFRKEPSQDVDVETESDAEGDQGNGAARAREAADLLIRNDNVFGDPHEDAIRRDFTINGLFYDIDRSVVIDYVGGMRDIERRVVETIGDPGVRLREDPVRILRAIKFCARLDLGIAPDLYDAMVSHRGELVRAAKARVLEELFRLLRQGAAHRCVYLCWDTGVLAVILPELASYLDDLPDEQGMWGRLDAIDRRRRDGRLPSDAVLLGALLYGPISEVIDGAQQPLLAFDDFFEQLGQRLLVPRRMRDRLRLMVAAQSRLAAGKLGTLPRRDFFADAATLYAIDCEAQGKEVPPWALDPASVDEQSIDLIPRSRRRPRRRR